MLGDDANLQGNQGILDRRLQGDFISQRYRAFNEEPHTAQKEKIPDRDYDSVWLGVSTLEKALASCCELPVKGPDELEGGALVKEKVLRFVGLLTLHCHDIESRALGLAVLERSLQVDKEERLAQDSSTPTTESNGTDEPPLAKKRRLAEPKIGNDSVSDKSPSGSSREELSPDRISGFLVAGGLHILNRWLVEATTPVNVPLPKPPVANGRPHRTNALPDQKGSSTALLLLPLLSFLSNIPFDRQLIFKSKVNKEIRKLSKQIDEIVQTAPNRQPKIRLDTITDPVVGNLPVVRVQKAVNKLKESWGRKAKSGDSETLKALDPFSSLRNTIQKRLEAIIDCDQGRADKPAWMLRLEDAQKEKEKKRPKKRPSTEQLGRRERENERSAMMKEDLRKAAIERSELLRKLREMKQKTDGDDEMDRRAQAKRGVQWKDGLGRASKLRKRDLLEEVFVFTKDNDDTGNKVDSEATTESGDGGDDFFTL